MKFICDINREYSFGFRMIVKFGFIRVLNYSTFDLKTKNYFTSIFLRIVNGFFDHINYVRNFRFRCKYNFWRTVS